MLKKLFGSDKKDNGFYLELDENKDNGVVKKAVETAKEQVEEIKDSKVVINAVETVTQTVETAKEQVESIVSTEETPAKAEPVVQKNGSKKTQKKISQGKKEDKSTTAKQQPVAPQPAAASSYEPPFWVKAMYKNNNSNGANQNSEATFATDYLMPTISKYRRRPGPSLNKFKEMANKAKTPRN